MGRRRTKNKNLPPRVYPHHGSYRYVPKHGKIVTLARLGDYAGMLRKLAEVLDERPAMDTLSAVMDRYLLEVIPDKGEQTQEDHARMLKNLKRSFGHMQPNDLRAHHAAKYRDKRAQKAPTAANRELQLLSHVCTMAKEWGAMEFHPLRRLRKISIPPRDRYVTDDEYKYVHGLASPMVRCVMDIGLLTGLRRGDIFKLRRDHMTDAGLQIKTSKTGAELLFEWTPALRQVVKDALKLKPQVRAWIVCNRKGQQFTKNGFDSVWARLMAKAEKKIDRFQFRDLRAKSASDEPELSTAQARLGHRSSEITERVYVRTAKKVRPLR